MRLLVPGGDSLEQSQKLFLFMRRILGLHHQPKAVEVPGVSDVLPSANTFSSRESVRRSTGSEVTTTSSLPPMRIS
jgi:hypothetical protein